MGNNTFSKPRSQEALTSQRSAQLGVARRGAVGKRLIRSRFTGGAGGSRASPSISLLSALFVSSNRLRREKAEALFSRLLKEKKKKSVSVLGEMFNK